MEGSVRLALQYGGCGGNGGGCSVPAEMYETKPDALGGGDGGERVRRPIIEQVGTCRGCRGCCRGGGDGGDSSFGCGKWCRISSMVGS